MVIVINIVNNFNAPKSKQTNNSFSNNSSRCTVSDFGTRKEGSLMNNKCECSNCSDSDFGSRKWSNVF